MTTAPTMTAEDLFRLTFLQEGDFSPDGRQVIYTVSHVDTTVDKEFVTIRLRDLESGEDRPLTGGRARDSAARFAPDGQMIAFLSDRGEKPQLYAMPIDGGEARPLTDLKQGAGSPPVWSPDGTQIAFTAGPEFEGESPLDLTTEVYRVTRHVYRFDDMGYLDQVVQGIYLLDVASGRVRRLTHDGAHYTELQWSPDGGRLLALRGMRPDSFMTAHRQLAIFDPASGAVRLFDSHKNSVEQAAWLPDGKRIAYVGRPVTGQPIGSKHDLWLLDLATGRAENRTAGLAVGVGGSLSLRIPTRVLANIRLPLDAAGENVFVDVQEGGNLHVYRVALEGEEAWGPVAAGERGCAVLARHGERLLLAVTDLDTPPDLFLAPAGGSGEEVRLTDLNGRLLSTLALPATEQLLFPGPDGVQVEGWFMKPPVGEAPYPTILYIHGGPHAAYGRGFSFDFQMLAGQGYGVLFINHRASTGYGDSFATAIKGDWGNLDYRDLMAGVDFAVARGLADPDRLGCCGTSGGGNLSTWIVGHTDRFKAAVPQNPVTNWYSFYGTSDIGVWFAFEQLGGHPHEIPDIYTRCSPITYAHRCTTPTLLVQSEHDWRCPAEQSEQFYTHLKAAGCTVEMLRQPGGAHAASIRGAINLRREHLLAMLDWFERYVNI